MANEIIYDTGYLVAKRRDSATDKWYVFRNYVTLVSVTKEGVTVNWKAIFGGRRDSTSTTSVTR